MRITPVFLLLLAAILASCSTQPVADRVQPMLPFHGAGNTELGVVSVKKGIDRGSIEWHLVADKVGEEPVTEALETRFGIKRLTSDEDLETILRTKFVGVSGQESARSLWKKYRSATFSGLECGNATIIFFDTNGLSVEAWPLLENVTDAEQVSGGNGGQRR